MRAMEPSLPPLRDCSLCPSVEGRRGRKREDGGGGDGQDERVERRTNKAAFGGVEEGGVAGGGSVLAQRAAWEGPRRGRGGSWRAGGGRVKNCAQWTLPQPPRQELTRRGREEGRKKEEKEKRAAVARGKTSELSAVKQHLVV